MRPPAIRHRQPRPTVLDPQSWPARTRRPRVLVEHPDAAQLWACAATLREAGYEVAVCAGPIVEAPARRRPGYFDEAQVAERLPAAACPLLTVGRCALAQDADVVVTTTALPDGRALAHAHGAGGVGVVVDDPAVGADSEAVELELPVTEQRLLAAVDAALG